MTLSVNNHYSIEPSELTAASGVGVRVLVLDSGVEITHPALAGRAIDCWRVESDAGGKRRIVQDEGGDDFGHGTACAAIICEHAKQAIVHSIKVMGQARGWSYHVLAALHWGIDRGYDIINCSFTTAELEYLAEYKSAIDRAFCRNVLIVSACNNNAYWRVEYPGSFPTVLSTDYGAMEALQVRHRRGELVEFVARGQDVTVPWKGGTWRVMTGSSMAAPHLSALSCRIREIRPQWNACEVKAALYRLSTTE